MRGPTWLGGWVLPALVGVSILCAPGAGEGEERLRAGMKDLTLSGGYSISHDFPPVLGELEELRGFHVLPHLGFVLSDERGPRGIRGNFELLVEPTLIHLRNGESSTVAGVSGVGRWVLATPWVVRPYLELALGIVGGQTRYRQTDCDLNFNLQGGVGLLLFVSPTTAISAGYRYSHISNADTCDANVGLNSSLFLLGVSYFFR